MNDSDYCISLNGNALGWVRGRLVAERVLQKHAGDLQRKDAKLCLRIEEQNLCYRLFYSGVISTSTTHVLRATQLKQLRDPANDDQLANAV